MKHLKQISLCMLLGISCTHLQAQESINTTGGNATGNGGSASYSVGQVVYTTHTSTSGYIAEGVQHAYEIFVVTAIEEARDINLSAKVYPNPATDYLTLNINESDISNIFYKLYDMAGQTLQHNKIFDNETTINMNDFVPATYFVKIIQVDTEVKTFKIIKR